MKKGYVLWFTGLSGSGKSTLARALAKALAKRRFTVEIIDGDQFRKKVHRKLGFSKKEIVLNNRKIIEYCLQILKKNNFVLVPVIAPFEVTRSMARRKIGASYIEIFCKASVEKCRQRDPKGLYKKALVGKLKNLIGIDKNVPYQEPKRPDLVVDTENLNKRESFQEILKYLNDQKVYESVK